MAPREDAQNGIQPKGVQMDRQFDKALTRLASGTFLHIRGGKGQVVAVFDGEVWITQDKDPRDIIIGSGESFLLDRSGPALVHALRPTKLLVLDAMPRPATPSWRRWTARIVHAAGS
jgi:hypothetical protein